MGFFAFYVAVGLSFLLTAHAARMAVDRRGGYALLSLGLLLVAYAHVFQAVITGLALLGVLAVRAPAAQRVRVVGRTVLASIPAALVAVAMLSVYLFEANFAGVRAEDPEQTAFSASPLVDLAQTYAGGDALRSWGLLAIPVLALVLAAARWRRASALQRVLLIAGAGGLLLGLLAPMHLGRWSFFAPRMTLFAVTLLPLAVPWAAGRGRRVAERVVVAAAVASLAWSAVYHRDLYRQLAPDLAALDAPVHRAGARLPMIMTSVTTPIAHSDPSIMLGHLYIVEQGGIDPYVWADTWSVDALQFLHPVQELFGEHPGRYPKSDLLAAGVDGRPPRAVQLDVFALWGRDFEDVILATDAPDIRAVYAQRGYRPEVEAGRVQLLRFEGCPLTLELGGPAQLPHGLIVQVGLPLLSRPVEQRLLDPGARIPEGGLTLELPRLPCGPLWLLVRSGLGAPPQDILHCMGRGGVKSALRLPEERRVPCTLAPVDPSALPSHHHE